jgi:hypothetical protein
MGRAITRADFEAVFASFAPDAVDIFNADGKVNPMLFCVTLGAQSGEISAMGAFDPDFVAGFYNDRTGRGKDVLRVFIQGLTTPGSPMRAAMQEDQHLLPDIVVQISEAWMGTATSAEHWAALKAKYGSVEHVPGRTEGILIALHSSGYSTLGSCPILGNPRRAELGTLTTEDGVFTGRLSMTIDGV